MRRDRIDLPYRLEVGSLSDTPIACGKVNYSLLSIRLVSIFRGVLTLVSCTCSQIMIKHSNRPPPTEILLLTSFQEDSPAGLETSG